VKTHRPYVIAEISANHSGSLETAKRILVETAKIGVSAVKFQTFTADQITVKSKTVKNLIPSTSDLWSGTELWNLMKRAEMPLDWHRELFQLAISLGLDAFSTPYHPDAVDFLLDLGVNVLKVSSFDVVNHPLLEKISSAGVPVIMSTGMSTIKELDEAVSILIDRVPKLILLKCTSSYPCSWNDTNIRGVKTLRDRYEVEVGFSDHSLDEKAACLALALGATVFEKHVKLDDWSKTLDSEFSATPTSLKFYIDSLKQAELILGSSEIKPVQSEKASLWERPSVVALDNIDVGEVFTSFNIGIRRPSLGLHPKSLSFLLGTKSTKKYATGEGIVESPQDNVS
jgi:sialic acid synthase SpsE